MSQEFLIQIEQVCRRRRRRRWLTAACLALAAVVVSAMVLMGLDRVLGIADPVGRLLSTITFAVLCGFIVHRCCAVVWQKPITALQIAHEVERQHPQLRDIVTSAWDFCQQAEDDPTAGSESLRRATVLRAAAAVDDIQWQQLIPRQPLRRAALTLASVAVTIGLLGCWLPQAMGIGLTRLMNPFNAAEWPRQHDLRFDAAPALLATGEDLALELRDTRGPLPSSVTMHYRTRRQGRWHEETQPLAVTDPARLKIRRSSLQESLQYRATGGDHHTMPWQPLDVLTPPHIETLQLTVHPPAYTGLAAGLWEKQARVYAGSAIQLTGKTDQPVTQVTLHSATDIQRSAQVGADQKSFQIDPSDWQIKKSGSYTLELTTPAGLKSRAPAEIAIEVVVDQPPEVRFVEPVEDLTILSTAIVPLVIEVHDELAIREIDLVYQRSDHSEAGDQRLELWRARDRGDTSSRQQQVEYLWQMADLSLPPGSIVEVHAQATDAQPATGQTLHALRLRVVSEEELWRQIVDRQTQIVETLVQLLRTQRELLGNITDWQALPDWSPARWTNAIHAVLFRQRQLADTLAAGTDSVLEQLASLNETIDRNRLARDETVDRLQTSRVLLQSLIDEPLPQIEQLLSEVVRLSQHSPNTQQLDTQQLDKQQLGPLLNDTAQQQEKVIATLRRTIDLLMQGNVLAQLERALSALRSEQQDLMAHCTTKITPQILRTTDANSVDQTAFASAVRRQRELARRLAELMLRLSQAADRLADENPLLAARLTETAILAGQLDLQATIQAAADQLAARRAGRSRLLQQQAIDDLAKLLARLAGQDAQGANERFERLQAAERKLRRLRKEVAKLHGELQKLTPEERQRESQRLDRRRETLTQRTEELTRQLERLRTARAASATRKAAEQLRSGKLESATTQRAKQQLDAAQKQLTDQRRQQQVALARLQLAQLGAKLADLLGREKAIQQKILRLQKLQSPTIELTDTQQKSLRQLTKRQADLRDEVLEEADNLTQLPVFTHLLKIAGATMLQIGDRLQQSDLGQPTLALAERAINQLTQLAEAVHQERKKLSNSQNTSGAGEGDQPADQPADIAQSQTLQLALGQLQLLKSLQTDLQQKTQILETQLTTNQPPTHDAAELAREQAQLADLARQLIPEPPDPPSKKLFPNLEQELEKPLDDFLLPNLQQQSQP